MDETWKACWHQLLLGAGQKRIWLIPKPLTASLWVKHYSVESIINKIAALLLGFPFLYVIEWCSCAIHQLLLPSHAMCPERNGNVLLFKCVPSSSPKKLNFFINYMWTSETGENNHFRNGSLPSQPLVYMSESLLCSRHLEYLIYLHFVRLFYQNHNEIQQECCFYFTVLASSHATDDKYFKK